MGEVLLAALVVALLGAAALALLAALTVLPFVLALRRADRRRVSANRVGALSLGGSGLGLAVAAYLALRTSTPLPVAVLPLLLAALGPLGSAVLPRQWLGRRGEHERLVSGR